MKKQDLVMYIGPDALIPNATLGEVALMENKTNLIRLYGGEMVKANEVALVHFGKDLPWQTIKMSYLEVL